MRRRLVELVRAGQTPEELARKYEPSAGAIRKWVVQAARDDGRRTDGLTTEEKEEELRRLRNDERCGRLKARTVNPEVAASAAFHWRVSFDAAAVAVEQMVQAIEGAGFRASVRGAPR